MIVVIASITWKYTYYAPNTISVIDAQKNHQLKKKSLEYITLKDIFNFKKHAVRKLWLSCYLPYATVHFGIIPALFLILGPQYAWYALCNKLLAECITNIHSFLVIAPNHSGDDIYKFNYHYQGKEQFLVHQVLGSVNYHTGNDYIDHLQIWLNYQIEHHIFPDLPMLQYQKIQPEVKALCERNGLPYIQENIFSRVRKLVAICVGDSCMLQLDSYQELAKNHHEKLHTTT
jgi:fatty acid desaturase